MSRVRLYTVATAGVGLCLSGLIAPLTADAWWYSSTYTETEYPIVLAHGAAGFDELFGVYDYFYGIPSSLESDGAVVYVTSVSAFSSTEARGEELLEQVEDILALTGAEKVNLIGHSHGGLDARYVAGVAPELVASVTTVGTPHQGAELAEVLRDNLDEDGFAESVAAFFANSLGDVLSLLSGELDSEQDAVGTLDSLSLDGAADFNEDYPAGLPSTSCGDGPATENGVAFYSWSGDSTVTNLLDPSDALLFLTDLVYSEDSDGLVGVCSSHLGTVIRDDYAQNHLDQVNQVFGLTYLFGSSPESVFRAHANRLQNAGL